MCDWSAWGCIFKGLSEQHRRVAQAVGITEAHILKKMSGSRQDALADAAHARFAAACAVNALLCETPAWQVEALWGQQNILSRSDLLSWLKKF